MIAFLILLVLVVGVLEGITLYDPLKNVFYSVASSRRSVNEGEPFPIESTVENRGKLPMTFLKVTENLPAEISFIDPPRQYTVDLPPDGLRLPTRLVSTVYLMPRQKLRREITGSLPKRGRYFLRGADLNGGDFLGLTEQTKSFHAFEEIVVLPKRAGNSPAITALGGFLGDISVRRFILEDPVLTLGFREYTGREPQKQIAWTQSLRTGKLLVKEFDHTLEASVTVLLNVSCSGEDRFSRIEKTFSLARTVCEMLEERRIQYSFLTNAMAAGALGLWKSVTEGLGESHLMAILEGLGRATYDPAERFKQTVERAARMAEQGRSHILITPDADPEVLALTRGLSVRTGGELIVVTAEDCIDQTEEGKGA